MASKELAELCEVILQDTYGELASSIVAILFAHGRLTASQISKNTKIPLAAVQRTLVALIQNRFVLYWQDLEGSKNVYYYANWQQCYSILWTGQIITTVNKMFSENLNTSSQASKAAEVVKNMHIFGHMKVQDYLDAHSPEDSNEISSVMTSLVKQKILTPLYDFEFHPIEDIFGQLYQKHYKLINADRSGPQSEIAKKGAATIAAETDKSALLTRKDEANIGLIKVETASKNGGANRARKIIGSRRNASAENESWTVDKDIVLSVNHEKYLLLARNNDLVKLASKRVGKVTGQVYKRLLACYESKISRCNQEIQPGVDFNISTMEVAKGIDSQLDVQGSIVMPSNKRKVKQEVDDGGRLRKKTRLDGDLNGGLDDDVGDDDDDLLDDDDAYDDDGHSDMNGSTNGSGSVNGKTSVEATNRHLELLADSPIRFVRKVGNRGGGEWFVPFNELVQDLKRVTYEDIITRKYGPVATRLLRVIREKGKVDEKLLSQITLLQSKDICSHLTDLQGIGCLNLQEVPKTNDRAPGRNFYLWFHKPTRAYSLLVQDLYKTMNRLYTRLGSERKTSSILLAKLEREDVKGNEETYLSAQEKRELAELRRAEEKLLVQLFRVEGLVRIFRDY
ncbi:Rpc82p [Sugiyamaella lignohabitans]|uniref:DNA-directed RNA polymerase III subunit RPC3 n=1 Tax=Sugiyamaella lignohabitans TaxID=796027 RepID=A0A167FAS1_9ASCO|nr:Rpc82p [Sugiyamaella lignohabitans]ANB15043.1 Rpc82p [Sugiyamaella lignohabitans]